MALREEAEAVLPALKAVAEWKAGAEGVRAVIGKRFALYPQPDRTEGEWAAWWGDYEDVLRDVPLACLEAAMRAWVARPTSEFMPKPGQLHELAFTTVSKSLKRYQRAKRALQLVADAEAPILKIPEGVAIDNAAEIRRMLSEFQTTSPATETRARFKPWPVETDEAGLSPQMRALMARRQADATRA